MAHDAELTILYQGVWLVKQEVVATYYMRTPFGGAATPKLSRHVLSASQAGKWMRLIRELRTNADKHLSSKNSPHCPKAAHVRPCPRMLEKPTIEWCSPNTTPPKKLS
eukprot:4681017-Pyramimonas_sp.AAC.2